jgi:hypothetical protein
VLLYVAAAWATWQLLRDWKQQSTQAARSERWFWKVLFAALVLLGINKQLDLQSALTEIGRIMATKQGWYENRHQYQTAFIAGMAMIGLTLLTATLNLIWGAPGSTFWALLGSTGLLIFVVIRAASFHHVDTVLGQSFSGLRVNWLLEMGALLTIICSAWRRRERI